MPKSSEKHPATISDGPKAPKRDEWRGPSSSLVNIAFPFSQISLQEPSKELGDMAAVLLDLIGAMAEWIPEERLEDLRVRALTIHDSLH